MTGSARLPVAALRVHLDERQVVEVVTTVGGCAMVSRVLVVPEVPPPAGEVAG